MNLLRIMNVEKEFMSYRHKIINYEIKNNKI